MQHITKTAEGRMPILGHTEGVCHVYVDHDADLEKAIDIGMCLCVFLCVCVCLLTLMHMCVYPYCLIAAVFVAAALG